MRMKLFTLLFVAGAAIISSSSIVAQEKVQWDFAYNSEDQSLTFKATMQDGWHIYSMTTDPSSGPVPTSVHFDKNKKVKFIEAITEPAPKEKYDANFEADVAYFEKEVVFQQKVKVKKTNSVKGHVTYMACNSTMCLPPVDVEFSITVN